MRENENFIQALKLFNEKANKLMNLQFVMKVKEQGSSFSLKWVYEDNGVSEYFERVGPSDEMIDAFVLTFRFFIQDNEISSLRNLGQFYQDATIDEDLKNRFFQRKSEFNSMLASQSSVKWNHKKLSKDDILKTFVYGGLAHANKQKKETFDAWKNNSALFTVVEFDFVETLIFSLKIIDCIKKTMKKHLTFCNYS